MGHQAVSGIGFMKAVADVLGFEGVKRIEVRGGVDEPLIATLEFYVDAKDEAALLHAVKSVALIDVHEADTQERT